MRCFYSSTSEVADFKFSLIMSMLPLAQLFGPAFLIVATPHSSSTSLMQALGQLIPRPYDGRTQCG